MKKSKDLYTYVTDICDRDTLSVWYKGLRLIPSYSAGLELAQYKLTIWDCREILETGYEPRKRGKRVIERWLDCGNKTYNVVVVRSYNWFYKEDIYLIKHIGRFTKRKK